ncbi:MAG: T9SS type A sorting domain-containing protein [Bacteroidota bacterium]
MKNIYVFLIAISGSLHGQILNAYAKAIAINGAKTTLTVTNVDEASHNFVVGGKVIIMQMQDNVIGTNTANTVSFGNLGSIAQAGLYEIGIISSRSPAAGTPTTITLAAPMLHAFNTGVNSSLQLITLRDLGANYTTTANITGLAWNSNVGGVIAIEVANTLTLSNNISANSIGFVGGIRNTINGYSACDNSNYATAIATRYAGKGESIYKNTNAAYGGGRGKILSGGGGGNDVNAGGGGGGNYTSGGTGGLGWVPAGTGCTPSAGGIGGLGLNGQITVNRIFMGGGGGGGHQNDGNGTVGGNGGGIIFIKANTIKTTGGCGTLSITANGTSAANGGNDGAGGAGAGGSIIMQVNSYSIAGSCNLSITANGGDGGSSVTSGVHGAGGGGGQGVVTFSSPQPTINVSTNTSSGNGGSSCIGCPASANGSPGSGPNNGGVINSISGPLPIELLKFEGKPSVGVVELYWSTASEINNDFFTVERSDNGIDFKVVGTLKAKNFAYITSNYQLTDNVPERGINYYRLKQTDFNGDYSYSNIIIIDFNDRIDFSVYPNPLMHDETLYISFNKEYATSVDLHIYDITGKNVFEDNISIVNHKETKIENLNLSIGIYIVRLNNEYINSIRKLIIK